jgi:hypothetical protein
MCALIGGSTMLTSCGKDFLDKKPTGNYTAETFYSSDAAVRKGTEPLYNRAWFDLTVVRLWVWALIVPMTHGTLT